MLDWLTSFLESVAGLVPSPVSSVIRWSLEGIGGLFGSLSFNVADAWSTFTSTLDALRAGSAGQSAGLLGTLEKIILHWIPEYAIRAWWWVTHPDQLAQVLVFYVVKWAEHYAWTIAPRLGKFVLALLVHNVRQIAALAEEILSAVL